MVILVTDEEVSNPPKKSRIYLFLGKIFKFRGGGGGGGVLSTKTSEIRKQRRIQNALEAPINQNFLGGDPPTPLKRRGNPTLVLSPLVPSALDLVFAGQLFRTRRRPCIHISLNGLVGWIFVAIFGCHDVLILGMSHKMEATSRHDHSC